MPRCIQNSFIESKDPMHRWARYSSQSIPNSHVWNSMDWNTNSFKCSHNTLIIFRISLHIHFFSSFSPSPKRLRSNYCHFQYYFLARCNEYSNTMTKFIFIVAIYSNLLIITPRNINYGIITAIFDPSGFIKIQFFRS